MTPAPGIDDAAALELLSSVAGGPVVCAIALGSGLAALEAELEDAARVPYSSLPGLPEPSVAGHQGRFVFGRLGGARVVLLAGRLHAYEGHALGDVVAPVRLLAGIGADHLLMTNAVGGIHPSLAAGDIVLVDDQLNVTFRSPLTGPGAGVLPRFVDMSAPFDARLRDVILTVAADAAIPLRRGCYAGVLGPAYETAAEVRMLASMGGDVVGMSTVPEVLAARQRGLRVAVLSLVTNRATGLSDARITHDDVLAAGARAGEELGRIVRGVVERLAVSRSGRSD